MDLLLTPDEAILLKASGTGVLFRAGEPCCAQLDHFAHIPHFHGLTSLPPVEFVKAAQACGTCEGTGNAPSTDWPPIPCTEPDCHNGKRRIAAVVPGMVTWGNPPQGAGYGHVTVGHVVVTWGPLEVVDNMRGRDPSEPCIEVAGPRYIRRWREDPTWTECQPQWQRWLHGSLPLPPDVDPQSLVGQYAIGVKVAP